MSNETNAGATTMQSMIGAADLEKLEEGSAEAVLMARRLVHQSASLCLLCSMAYHDAIGDPERYEHIDQLSEIAAAVMEKCWDDLSAASAEIG